MPEPVADKVVVFRASRLKTVGLVIIFLLLGAGAGWAAFLPGANWGARAAGAVCAALFAVGLALATLRLVDGRPALRIDSWGVRDRRMLIEAPWGAIRAARIWRQEGDSAGAQWIALDVSNVSAVRPLNPLWASVRRFTLERLGRPAVTLKLAGLNAPPQTVLAAIRRFRPGLVQDQPPPPAPKSSAA